ncbi:MAG: hypothetical protein QI199_01315, partial [Candidatus Korarchaeota archaeon]|nr:hypothetical protein [Candidatus Korarchaeota archaeon]
SIGRSRKSVEEKRKLKIASPTRISSTYLLDILMHSLKVPRLSTSPTSPDALKLSKPRAEHFTEKDALKAKECSKKIVEWVERCPSIRR